jgi:protein-tyrosine phosphatase
MIDIHHHCLPGVDDGPREWDEAVAMCRMAAAEGIEAIIATPHVLRALWPSPGRRALEKSIARLRNETGGTPALHLGSEYFFAHDMPEALQRGDVIPLADSRYVLLELAADSVPPMIEQPLYRAQLDGWTPIIAHPERNVVFQQHPEILERLVRHGAFVQLTAGSLTGHFGERARAAATNFLKLNLVHFVATDAHNLEKRPPAIKAARAALQELAGDPVAEALMVANPRAVVENRPLAWVPDPAEVPSGGLLTRLRRFLPSRGA